MVNITKELQDTLIHCPKIKTVYFDAKGRHYFNVHKLFDNPLDEKRKEDLYGSGSYSHHQKIAGLNVDNLKEAVAKGNKDTLIVDTLTRDEVLNHEVVEKTESLISKVASMSPEELDALRSLLFKQEAKQPPVAPTVAAPKK